MTLYETRKELVVVLKVSVCWSPLPSKVSMSWALGQVPVVWAQAGLGSPMTSQDKNNTRLQDATNIDTTSEATLLRTADSHCGFLPCSIGRHTNLEWS